MTDCRHDWWVTGREVGFRSHLIPRGNNVYDVSHKHQLLLILDCQDCDAFATLELFQDDEEWGRAQFASRQPYPFDGDPSRVTVRELREF